MGIENLLLLQNDACDDLVNESWCGFDFGSCNAPETNSQGINELLEYLVSKNSKSIL